MAVVVDTNVAAVAEGIAHQANQDCIDACQDRLIDIIRNGGLLLDEGDVIIGEYTRTLGHAGQPGLGRAFVKWAFDHRYNSEHCRLVRITERDVEGWRLYEEFPDRPDLEQFHADDQKFVAVALASGANPPILNAVDSDYWDHFQALTDAGVAIEFVCPQHRSV